MNKKQNAHIKSLINKKSIDKAPVDFTSKVMHDVFDLTNKEGLKDVALSSLLKRTSIEEPSSDFVSNIITQVNTEKEIQYQPLISKKAWFIISGIVIAFIVFLFLNDAPKDSSSILDRVSPYLDQTQRIFSVDNPFKGFTLSPLFAISIMCLSTLLLLDTFLKRRPIN